MYHLFIATPEKVFFDDDVTSLVAPGFDGYFGVLANHASFITPLTTGKIEVKDKNNTRWIFALSGGFFQVKNNKATLLADSLEATNEIDVTRAKLALKKLEKLLKRDDDNKLIEQNVDVARAKKALARALNRIKIANEKDI